VKSIKTECLEQFVLFGEASLHHVIREYLAHYHVERNHQGIENVIPFPDRRLGAREGKIVKTERLGGLLNFYHRPHDHDSIAVVVNNYRKSQGECACPCYGPLFSRQLLCFQYQVSGSRNDDIAMFADADRLCRRQDLPAGAAVIGTEGFRFSGVIHDDQNS